MNTHTSIFHLLPVHPPHLPMKSQTYAVILLHILCITSNSSNLTSSGSPHDAISICLVLVNFPVHTIPKVTYMCNQRLLLLVSVNYNMKYVKQVHKVGDGNEVHFGAVITTALVLYVYASKRGMHLLPCVEYIDIAAEVSTMDQHLPAQLSTSAAMFGSYMPLPSDHHCL